MAKITLESFKKQFISNITMSEDDFAIKYPILIFEDGSFEHWKDYIAMIIFHVDCGMCDDWETASNHDFVESDARYGGVDGVETIGESLKNYIAFAESAFEEECEAQSWMRS